VPSPSSSSDPVPSRRGGRRQLFPLEQLETAKNPSLAHVEPPQSRGSSPVPQSSKGTENGNGVSSAQCPKLDINSSLPTAQCGIRTGQDPELNIPGSSGRVLASGGSSHKAGRSPLEVRVSGMAWKVTASTTGDNLVDNYCVETVGATEPALGVWR